MPTQSLRTLKLYLLTKTVLIKHYIASKLRAAPSWVGFILFGYLLECNFLSNSFLNPGHVELKCHILTTCQTGNPINLVKKGEP